MSREAFESMIIDGGRYPGACEKGADGQYIKPGTLAVWLTWQAALAWAYEDAARVCDERAGNGNNGKWWALKATADELRERAKEVTR